MTPEPTTHAILEALLVELEALEESKRNEATAQAADGDALRALELRSEAAGIDAALRAIDAAVWRLEQGKDSNDER